MKQFCVSSNCTACGECLLQTNLLEEDATGHAVPVLDRYISDTEMAVAEEIVASCPAHALSIAEKATASLDPDSMIASLKGKLENIDIPSTPNCKITFDENDYSVDYGFISGEGSFDYSSKSQALSAGRSQFRATFWNRRKDFALSFLAQYKSKRLRPFYDFTNPDKTYFAQFSKQFSAILKEARAELSAISGDSAILPESFASFNPEMDHDMQTSFAMKWLQDIDSVAYVNNFFEGFEKNTYHRLSCYEDRIYSNDDVQVVGTDWLGNNKIKTTYSFNDANSTGKDLVNDIAFWLNHAGSYGVRNIDDIAEDNVKSLIKMYRELAKETIQQKIFVYSAAVKAMTQTDRKADKPKEFIGTLPKQLTDINYSLMQAPTLCSETERQKKILQLCIEGWNILYSTQNYLVYRKHSFFYSSSKEVFCLNLRILEVTSIPNPDELSYGPSPIIVGDCIIYSRPNGCIYAYDIEHLRLIELMKCDEYTRKLQASTDYIIAQEDYGSAGIRYLSRSNYSVGVFKQQSGAPYDCLTRKKVYRVNTDGFHVSGKGRLESYDLDEKLGMSFGVVPCNFEPFAEHGTKIYGMVSNICNECALYAYDTASDKLTKAFYYERDSRSENKFDKGGNLRIFAGKYDSENYNVYCLNLETGEIGRLMSAKANIELVARFESTLYYMETRSKQTRLYAMELVGVNHSPVEIGLVFGSNSKD